MSLQYVNPCLTGNDMRGLLDYSNLYKEAYEKAFAEAKAKGTLISALNPQTCHTFNIPLGPLGMSSLIVRRDANEVENYVLPVPQTLPSMSRDATRNKEKPAYMPKHLPAYPDIHTFVRTPVVFCEFWFRR